MTPEALTTLHQHLLTALGTAPAETRRLFHGRGEAIATLGAEQNCARWVIPLSGTVRAGEETASAGQCLYFTQPVELSAGADVTALIVFEGQS